jgi:hypothetical protein
MDAEWLFSSPPQEELEQLRREIIDSANGKVNEDGLVAKMVILCAVDEGGRRLFTKDDFGWLNRYPAKVLMRLRDACMQECGMNADDIEETMGNSGRTEN